MEVISVTWIVLLGIWMATSWRSAWILSIGAVEKSEFLDYIDSLDTGQRGLLKINYILLLISFIAYFLIPTMFLFLIHQIVIIGIIFANIALIQELQKLEEE